MDSFPRPKAKLEITTDVVIFSVDDNQLKVLLIKRTRPPYVGSLVLPGGFLWQDETTAEAAARLLKDKTGLKQVFIEQLFTFDDPKRDNRGRVLSVSYFALVPANKIPAGEINKTIFLQKATSTKNLAFDHNQILNYAVKRLRTKLAYSNVAYSLLPELFTFSELQKVYEIILGREIDKRNFRKKILSLDIIEPTNQKMTGKKHRPARFYRFKKRRYAEFEGPAF